MSTFQEITQQALATNYGVRDIFDSDEAFRLATLVANRNTAFANDFKIRGHEYSFRAQTSGKEDDRSSETSTFGQSPFAPSSETISSRKVPECEDVQEILHDAVDIPRSMQFGINGWIQKLYSEARGFEIGTFNYALLSTLLKKQSARWPMVAYGYISDIIAMVHQFIAKVLGAACGDEKISTNILSLLMDGLMDKYRQALSTVEFLLKIEREGTPMTLNHYMNDTLQKW